jgi:pyruvate dehydrogenase E1 component alpha subunit
MTTIQPAAVTQETALGMYRTMTEIRLFEKRAYDLFLQNLVKGTSHLGIGQEAVAAGVSAAMSGGDYMFVTYRGHAHVLARGTPMTPVMAELLGRENGLMHGKGGSMHLLDVSRGILGAYAIVGAQLVIANGAAWSAQYRGSGQVTVCFLGDGATNIGAFHEALNLAALWKLPVIFVCHNNGYAEHTRYDLGTASATIAQRAQSYGMRGVRVDGNDPLAMWAVVENAVADARAGNGPTLIEAMTFRFNGHNFGDPAEYISKREMEEALARDPIPRYRAALIERGIADETRLAAMEAEIAAQIDQAIEFALASPFPSADELHRDVYAEEVEP